MTEQGSRRGAGRTSGGSRPPPRPWPGGFEPDADPEAEPPPWAGLAVSDVPRRTQSPATARRDRPPDQAAGGPERLGRAGRGAALRRQRSRRRQIVVAGLVVLAAAGAAAGYALSGPAPARSPYVQQLQPGEFGVVPDACRAVSPAILGQYLPGHRSVTQPQAGTATSECTFTADARPVFRVLDVAAQAYQPNLAVPGDGSATDAAISAFAQARHTLAAPGRHAPVPAAALTPLRLGDSAVIGQQRLRLAGSKATIVIVTVVIRTRNVVITARLQGQVAGGGFAATGPVLRAGALAAAGELLAAQRAEPRTG